MRDPAHGKVPEGFVGQEPGHVQERAPGVFQEGEQGIPQDVLQPRPPRLGPGLPEGRDDARGDEVALVAGDARQGVEGQQNPGQLRQAHELAGRIALAEKDYDKAIAELEQANLQDPRNLYRLSQAYQAKGDSAKAQEYAKKVVDFNSLPALNYAFVRSKVQKELSAKKM